MAKKLDEKYIDKQKRSKEYHEESKNWMRNAEMREKVQKTSRKGKKKSREIRQNICCSVQNITGIPAVKSKKKLYAPIRSQKNDCRNHKSML